MTDLRIWASYVCEPCDITGSDLEVEENLVYCWNCGKPATVTARIAKAE